MKTRFTIKMTFGEDHKASALSPEDGLSPLRNPLVGVAIAGAALAGYAESLELILAGMAVAGSGALPVLRTALRAGRINHSASRPLPTGR